MIADVVIAGGGPNGLMLAFELSLAGVRPIVLERLAEPSAEPKANGLVGQVVEMLDRRGLYERLAGSPGPPQPVPGYMFGALPLDLTMLEDNPIRVLPVPQPRLTRVLAERAVELGVELRWGHELVALSRGDDAVAVTVAGPDGEYRLQARYLVGADGGHSATRKLSGIDFPGITTDRRVSRAAHAYPPAEWVDPDTGALTVPGYGTIPARMHHRNERGLFVFAQFPGRPPLVNTTEFDVPDGDETPMTLDELRASIRRVLGVDVPLEAPTGDGPHLLRRLVGGNTRLAERVRDGRVLLVGDAAHVHSAMGGPGLNLGLQDAINLGWKLAAEIHGWAPPGLLDSYAAERVPVARRVVMQTQAQSALIAPGSEVTALRELFAELLRDPANAARIAGLIAGTDVRYDLAAPGAHPLVGLFAPDLALRTSSGAVRLGELTTGARPLLVDLTDGGSPAATAAGWRERVEVVRARPGTGLVPATALLLRPDCYVAWASASPDPDPEELGTLRTAMGRWFGAPTRDREPVG
ncbi:FAD-dependent monooxygenase [Rugosimonospora acidiphila]|uniref:FAD-dependent monooxygenase n=1 Tax=Rugosimonospora acidiphila TaxID=556531 RepID=A0ABP9SCT2_9ACTN